MTRDFVTSLISDPRLSGIIMERKVADARVRIEHGMADPRDLELIKTWEAKKTQNSDHKAVNQHDT